MVRSVPSFVGAPEGWAGLPLALAPLARASILALGWDRAPSPGAAVKGCLEKPRVYFSSVPSFSLAPVCQGKTLTSKLGAFLEAQLTVDMLPWAVVCRGRGSIGTPRSPGWPYPGRYCSLASLVREMKLWMLPLSMVPEPSGWVRKAARPPPARLEWTHQHPHTTSWAFQEPWHAGDCPAFQKRSPGILVTSLALKKGCSGDSPGGGGQSMMGY